MTSNEATLLFLNDFVVEGEILFSNENSEDYALLKERGELELFFPKNGEKKDVKLSVSLRVNPDEYLIKAYQSAQKVVDFSLQKLKIEAKTVFFDIKSHNSIRNFFPKKVKVTGKVTKPKKLKKEKRDKFVRNDLLSYEIERLLYISPRLMSLPEIKESLLAIIPDSFFEGKDKYNVLNGTLGRLHQKDNISYAYHEGKERTLKLTKPQALVVNVAECALGFRIYLPTSFLISYGIAAKIEIPVKGSIALKKRMRLLYDLKNVVKLDSEKKIRVTFSLHIAPDGGKKNKFGKKVYTSRSACQSSKSQPYLSLGKKIRGCDREYILSSGKQTSFLQFNATPKFLKSYSDEYLTNPYIGDIVLTLMYQ